MNIDVAVKEIMTTDLVTVGPNANLEEVSQIFASNSFHHLPVVEENTKLIGIISQSDFQHFSHFITLQKTTTTQKEEKIGTKVTKASDIMTSYPLSLDPEDSIGLAADIFLANKFHALPVVEDNKLLGIVTSHDLLKYCFDASRLERNEEFIDATFGI